MRWLPASVAVRLSSRTLLASGLASIVICALLLADLLGLVPDRVQAQREGRVALAESVALSSALLAARGDADALERYLATIHSRNEQLTAVRLRSQDGSFVIEAGQPATPAALLETDTASTDTRVVVPVLGAGGTWGHVELHFVALSWLAEWAPWLPPAAPLALGLAMFCTLAFHLYLKRMLRHLDPSNVIPERVRTAFDTLAEGLLVLDPQGNIVLANKAFAHVVGVDAGNLAGRGAASLPWRFRPQTQANPSPDALLPWVAAQNDGQLRYGTALVLTGADGQTRTFMVNSAPIAGGGAKPAGVLVSFDDVTELEQKEIELRQARDAAQQANQSKSDFLANMSHEIRTPMNAILGFTDVLRRRGWAQPAGAASALSAAEAQRYLNIVHSSGKHLLTLINDILDLSKIEAGHLEVERMECAAHEVVHEVVQIMQVKATEKGIGLQWVVEGALPAHIQSDPARLRQILTNLVGNAIKFTSQGQVRVLMRMGRSNEEPASSAFCIDVADSGIGIPAQRLEAIFEPFVQAESSTTRQFGGTGLGLTISRRFARALGGDVHATSQAGKGSVFHVRLDAGDLEGVPWLSAEAVQAQLAGDGPSSTETAAQSSWVFPPRRVLVVDDGAENRELVQLVLQEVGLQVLQANNGQVGLTMALEHRPDLVLMDIQMPVMDGLTATRLLRERGFDRPVLALTANAMKGFEEQIQDNGFTGHLTKPIDIDLLLQTLAEHLGGQACARVASAQPLPRDVPSQAVDQCANTAPPIESRLANHPRLAKVARSFCAQLPAKLAEMQSALDAEDFLALATLAHWLKGAGGSVGFDPLYEPALELENAAKASQAERSQAALHVLQAMALRIVAPGAGATAQAVANTDQAVPA